MTVFHSDLVRSAFLLAEAAHKHQTYGDEKVPYLVHLFDVMMVLIEFKIEDQDLLAAALLHDVIEDTVYKYHHVKHTTNSRVAEIVYALTDEIGRNRKERHDKTYVKLDNFFDAQLVKLADWIANVRQCKRDTDGKLQMYKKEYPEFEHYKQQAAPEHPFIWKMWAMLDELLDKPASVVDQALVSVHQP